MSSPGNSHSTTCADRMLLATLVLLSVFCFVFLKEVMPQGSEVRVEVDGKPAYALPLSIDKTVAVEGPLGKTIVEIKNGRVRVKDSPCHNKLCVHQGWTGSGAVICLPNRVFVIVTGRPGARDKDFDGITG